MMRQLALAAAMIGLGLAPTTGRADISFELAPGGSPNTNLDYEFVDDFTAIGSIIGGGPEVLTIETDTALTVPAGGQAAVVAADVLFSRITITPTGSFVLLGFEADPGIEPGGPSNAGFFFVTATDGDGNSFDSRTSFGSAYVLGTGENFFTVLATNDQVIAELNIFATSDSAGATPAHLIQSLKQVRVDLDDDDVTVVPEPGTMVMAATGLVLAGAGGLRRRFRSRKVTA